MHIPKKDQFMNEYAVDIIMKLNVKWLLCTYLHKKRSIWNKEFQWKKIYAVKK